MANFMFIGGRLQSGVPCHRRIKAGISLKFRETGICGKYRKQESRSPWSDSCRHKTSTATRRKARERQRRQQGCRQPCRWPWAVPIPATCPHRQLAPSAAPGRGSPAPRQASREPCLFAARGKGLCNQTVRLKGSYSVVFSFS